MNSAQEEEQEQEEEGEDDEVERCLIVGLRDITLAGGCVEGACWG